MGHFRWLIWGEEELSGFFGGLGFFCSPPIAVALNAIKAPGSHVDSCGCIEISNSYLKALCPGVFETIRILL